MESIPIIERKKIPAKWSPNGRSEIKIPAEYFTPL
jgi:hypothetical protein